MLQTFPAEGPGTGDTGEETLLSTVAAPAADSRLVPVLLLVTLIAALTDRSGQLGVEEYLAEFPSLQHLLEAGSAPLWAPGDGGAAEEDFAIPGIAGTSLAGTQKLRRDY